MSGGLILPDRLQGERQLQSEEKGRTTTLANGCEVKQRHVWMKAKGWRHEVTASWTERQAGEATVRMDTLWLATALDAERLAGAAADRLTAGALRDGLSGLARELRIELPRA